MITPACNGSLPWRARKSERLFVTNVYSCRRRHVVSTRTFARVDHHIFSSLWRWARRRHPNKTTRWCKRKYFARRRGRDWSFFGETWDDEGQPSLVWLRHAPSTLIRR